jgi:ComF family protein
MYARFQNAARSLQALVLGQRCAACDAPCQASPVCGRCTQFITSAQLRCLRCATGLPVGTSCGACIRKPPSFDAAVTVGHYVDPLRTLIAQFKFNQRLVLAPWFAAQLDARLNGLAFDVITPMALHDNRLRERGYNQAWEIVKHLQLPASKRHLLTRLRDTPSQRSVSAAQRFSNVRGAFVANESLDAQHVLLVDDVVTTTATVEAASQALKAAGAARVTVACLARVSD